MQAVKFKTAKDLMDGIRMLVGSQPIVIVDGLTYMFSDEGVKILSKRSIKFDEVNGSKIEELKIKFKKILVDEC